MPRKHLDRGRRAYARRAWKDAHELLSLADRESSLRAADLERLATAAYLIGRETEFDPSRSSISGRASWSGLARSPARRPASALASASVT